MSNAHDRALKIAARMDANDDGSIPAFVAMTKILTAQNTSWASLIEKHLASQPSKPRRSTGVEKTADRRPDGAEVFDFNAWWFATMDVRPTPRPTVNTVVTGKDIPSFVSGIINILDRRETRHGAKMLVIEIENSRETFSPIVVFDHDLVAAIETGRIVSGTARIKAPLRDHLNPILDSFSDVSQPKAA